MPLIHRSRPGADVGRRLVFTIGAVAFVILVGTIGYVLLGVAPIDALYGTVFTVTTVGFKEIDDFGTVGKLFTICLMLIGTGTVLYSLTLLMASVVDGHVGSLMERRRMQREIDRLTGHVIVCGFGRVGRATAQELARAGKDVVVIDRDEGRFVDVPYPYILGNASSDEVLREAGIERAAILVASLDTDADSLYLTLSSRALNPDLMVIARARTDDSEHKFTLAGADRVVNPQRLGGDRIAAFALQPHVVDFLDVAMHSAELEFRLENVEVRQGSPLAGSTVRATREREGGGAMLLALRSQGGQFVSNPPADRVIEPGDVMIVVGTALQLQSLQTNAGS